MAQYLVSLHHPIDYDTSTEDKTMERNIDTLNDEMVAAGVRVFVGGLVHPPSVAKSIRLQADGSTLVTNGSYLKTAEQVAGFWVLDVASEEEALKWGRKAAVACRAPIEVRAFY